jgi:hypothetical protein
MSLTIYPLNLGEVEVDFSFLVWQTNSLQLHLLGDTGRRSHGMAQGN